jgi:MtN3 and saliva related transmembrane protein
MITLIGLAAACATTFAFVPQVAHTLRTRDTRGISLGMYGVFTAGVALWLVYGLALRDLPLIAANGATLVLAGAVLACKLRYG